MQPDVSAHPLAESAKGWHNLQLAVMGFVGFCGVLRMGEPAPGPEWLGWWSGIMFVAAFLASLLSAWMVGTVAFPFYSAQGTADMPPDAAGRLRGGIKMTFVALALMGLAAVGAWWPEGAGADSVEVTDARGGTACGTWVDGAPAGSLWLQTADGLITVSLSRVAEMRPVASC